MSADNHRADGGGAGRNRRKNLATVLRALRPDSLVRMDYSDKVLVAQGLSPTAERSWPRTHPGKSAASSYC
jgi:hypothetical protein